jgi:hypothetical protein
MDVDETPSSQSSFVHSRGLTWRNPAEYNLVGPSRLSQQSQFLLSDNENLQSEPFPPSAWTNATNDDGLVMHLLALYFCWEYPVFASFSKEHFLGDFNNGKRRFCSPLLVNCILALGAQFSDLPEARKNPEDPDSVGEQFYEEAQRLLGFEDLPTLTKIQSLGLMSLRQASAGNDMSSWHLSRMATRTAIDLGLHRRNAQDAEEDHPAHSVPERQVSAATFWGCYTLEV